MNSKHMYYLILQLFLKKQSENGGSSNQRMMLAIRLGPSFDLAVDMYFSWSSCCNSLMSWPQIVRHVMIGKFFQQAPLLSNIPRYVTDLG